MNKIMVLIIALGMCFIFLPPELYGEEPPLCDGQPATIWGTEGHEIIRGTDGPDIIQGLNGHDLINGKGGDDIIFPGSQAAGDAICYISEIKTEG